jgi:hypothetical protein
MYVWVRTWNSTTATTWTPLGNSSTGSGFTQVNTTNVLPRIAIDSSARPIVTWEARLDINDPAQIFVRRWSGTAWDEVGFHSAQDAGISNAVNDALAPALAVTPSGDAATIAWLDVQDTGSGQVFVRQLSPGSPFPLTTRVAGSGRVTSDPIGVECSSASCVAFFPSGTSVSLVPQPAAGSAFAGWAGACTGTGPCTVSMTTTQSVNASFVTIHRLTLAVAKPVGTPTQGIVGSIVGPAGTCPFGGSAACVSDVLHGTRVVLQATPDTGNRFLSWTGGPCTGSTNRTCSFTMSANVSATALFRAVTGVRVLKAGNGAGTVTGVGISCGTDCLEEVFMGTSVTLTPAPATGSRFLGWTGDVCNGQATGVCVVTTAGQLNRSVTATFQLIPYLVTVANRANGTAASINSLPINCGAGNSDCQATLDFGTQVVLQATPIVGSRFVNWTGTVCAGSTNATCAFKIPAANVSVSPNFKNVTALTLNKSGRGAVVSTPAGITCGTACTTASFDFARGILIKLTPTPAVGWNFDGFSGGCSGATCSVNASGPTALVGANFSIQHKRLTVTVVGQGTVGGGASCDDRSTPCTLDFDYGTTLSLTATAAPGYRFTGWSQSCSGIGACAALMTINRSVTATFKPQFGLTVTKVGNSTGTITATASPVGIPAFTCGAGVGVCSSTYLGGQVVTLTRTTPVGTTFRWGGDCAFRGTNATCALTLNASASVTADFSLQRLGLTVAKNGAALGTVTGLAGAIVCGVDCAEVVDYGTLVTLLATPSSSPAGQFASWAGCGTAPSNASCSFVMTANRTVTATFRPVLTSVTVDTIISTDTLPVNGVRQLAATANFSDGSRRDVTTQAVWAPLTMLMPMQAAIVNTTGRVTGLHPGNTSVTATFGPLSGSRLIQVDALTAAPLSVSCNAYGDASVDPSPQLACLPSGRNFSVHCKAMGTFTSAGTQEITDQVTWSSTNAAVAQPTGLVAFNSPVRQSFRMVGNGTAVLRATLGGKTSSPTGTLRVNPWVVQGVPAPVTDLQVTPATANVGVGNDVQLVATATLTGTAACPSPPPRDFSTIVTWTSSAKNLAAVSFFGKVTGIAPGGPVITATYPIVNGPDFVDQASITVLP